MVKQPPVKRPSTRSSNALATCIGAADQSTSTSNLTASASSGTFAKTSATSGTTKTNPTTTSRSTTSSTTKAKAKAKAKQSDVKPAASSKTKTIARTTASKKVVPKPTKPIEQVELDNSDSVDSSDSDDSSSRHAPAPKLTKSTGKKNTEPIKKSTKAVKATIASTSKSGAKIATKSASKKTRAQSTEDVQVVTTSTPSPSSAQKLSPCQTANYSKVTAIPLTWDEQCKSWFTEYASEDDPELINFDGIQTLFEHMDISLADVTPLVLSWKLKASTFGSYSLADWQRTFRRDSVKSTLELKEWLLKVEKTLWPDEPIERSDAQLHEFYLFLFSYMMPEGQKTLPGDVAITIWDLVLARRFETGLAIVRYGQSFAEGTFRGVSKDVYQQVWDFADTVTPDLKGWSEEDAWPSTIDAFVEWQQKQLKSE
ncbi:BQ2448_2561 [Microbotryum intermedium]|uniref:Defective in cullin neddylation protein n=1 Tax=Microbotryum intermedium TaxID=269621 RepID=A0A238FBS3_9BASI|nr:BQ2448_2561 [Microbotryum intermedium]